MYLKWDTKTITVFSDKNINSLYNTGYVFTRLGRGIMNQTRSLRIDLNKFELSSENRRILKKTDKIKLSAIILPYPEYDWKIGKLAKDFYDTKFGDKTLAPNRSKTSGSVFSANKIKELLTDQKKSNFNLLLIYNCHSGLDPESSQAKILNRACPVPRYRVQDDNRKANDGALGFAVCHATDEILHYSYPFYNLEKSPKDMGLGMMIRAIIWAKKNGKKFVYLGSASRPSDTYKMQFAGVEWFDQKKWIADIETLKQTLVN